MLVKKFLNSKLQFPITFLACLAALMSIYYLLPTIFIENIIVRYFAVLPSAWFLDAITSDISVKAEGTRIISNIARLNVLKGCEGTEALLILYAAVIAGLRPIKFSLAGLIVGTSLIFILNQIRITALFFIAAYNKSLFELVHGFIAPLLIIGAAGLFFMLWLKWSHTQSLSSAN